VMDIRSNIVLQTLKEDSGVPVALVATAVSRGSVVAGD
jgi:Lrp/AsnC family leucine-responsive transcriptional regulator